MKVQLTDQEMDRVVGGTVIISSDYMKVKFTTTGEKFDLKNCSFYDARDLVDDLYRNNSGLGDAAFDNLVKEKLQEKGWI